LVVLPQAAHMLAVERPDVVASYLSGFLDRLVAR
jgi:pimeloyl-ACP methyl ester carboxylesterase